ncbi:hypothetical protein NGM37_26715 [Streptomyces sp. TRM76130]|nr:hypothetical protein [Streptomyces sp. TRM76130]
MNESTHDQPTTDSPPAYNPVRWCGWCRSYRTGCVLISLQDSATIPTAPTLYACKPCRQVHHLVPISARTAQP